MATTMVIMANKKQIGGNYNWKHLPDDQLIYIGKKGLWHQFRKIGDPREVWCEVLDEDLHMIEETQIAGGVIKVIDK